MKRDSVIKTLKKKTQVIRNWCGSYDMSDGHLSLGCDEEHTAVLIWHEIIHKILFEQFYLEACVMWDNISDELQYYLFNINKPDLPWVWSTPPSKAKSMDGGKWESGKAKQHEKSERIGWKWESGKTKRKLRSLEEIASRKL